MKVIVLALVFLIVPRVASAQLVDAVILTPDDVLEMMSHIPICEHGCKQTFRYDRMPDAREIAEGITLAVNGSLLDDPRLEAALMATYAAFEGQMRRCAVGDHGRALGAYQLWGEPRWRACDPRTAARIWYARAKATMSLCPDLPFAEKLAPLASGRCDVARRLVSHRYEVAQGL